MLALWLKLKTSAKLVAWAAPHVHQWKKEREFNQVEGDRQIKAHNYPEAEAHLVEAIGECEARHSSHATRLRLQLQLAEAQRKQGEDDPSKFDDAEATIRSALELTARISNPSGYVQCLDALAEVFHDRGDLPSTQTLIEEGIRIEAAIPHPDQFRMARRIHRLGVTRHLMGEDGIPALEKAVHLHQQAYGEDHLETAGVLTDIGILYRTQNRHEEAQECLRRALRIHQRECGPDSAEAIRDLHNLAGSHEETGDIEGAAALYERTLELKDRLVGGDAEELAEMQFAVASLYIEWGNACRARELLAMCIGTFRGRKGPRLAIAYETVAHIEECSGRYKDALMELEKGGKVWESCGPERAAELATNLEYRANLLDLLKKKDSADWLRGRAAAARAGQST